MKGNRKLQINSLADAITKKTAEICDIKFALGVTEVINLLEEFC
jgi:hypothetical protein